MKNYKAIDIANYIVWYVNQNNLGALTPLKLHKILYYVATTYVQQKNELLFNDSFEKWQYGPVVTHVYHNFKDYGINHISEPVQVIEMDPGSFLGFKKVAFDRDLFKDDPDFTGIANDVIEKLIKYRAFDLVEISHQEKAWSDLEPLIKSGTKDLKYTKDELLQAKKIQEFP